ncbi:hypothetical protein NY2A_b665L [Paramecium bursaria Chlorella virus NY2A]|uniref:Uncharacterized protein b665L n=1 Tax=Paramecium bursaria Chlorella virus NY2A TaxID=46021 RepID=A7IXJ0_PBCVN|nr:hypothetical protein NY2A_b665L [Paramecium bursaria Chlorella virus NY2A]ABT15064.1 hypothetical protein NY2A_b665L [Paramecium bursaria Chlorella virus NY2A]
MHRRIFQFPNAIFKMLQIYLKTLLKIFQNPLPNATNAPPIFPPIFFPTSPILPPMSFPVFPISLPLSMTSFPMSFPMSLLLSITFPPTSPIFPPMLVIDFFILNGSNVFILIGSNNIIISYSNIFFVTRFRYIAIANRRISSSR